MLLAMVGLALAGSVLSILLLMAVGYQPPEAFVSWFLGSARTSLIITLTFGDWWACPRRLEFDVLFLDIQMPGLTGFELLDRLDTDVPVIFTTAETSTRCGRSAPTRSTIS